MATLQMATLRTNAQPAYNISGIRYKKSIGQKLSAIIDSVLGQEDYAKP